MLMIQNGLFCTHQLKNAEYSGGAPNGGYGRAEYQPHRHYQ